MSYLSKSGTIALSERDQAMKACGVFNGVDNYIAISPDPTTTTYNFSSDTVGQAPIDWEITSGAYTVQSASPSPFGSAAKYLRCDTAGVISIPSTWAFGTIEMDVYKALTGNSLRTIPIASATSGWAGYSLNIFDTEDINLSRAVGGVNNESKLNSAASYIANATWYRLKVVRNEAGVFSVYIKANVGGNYVLVSTSGGGGQNPVTDLTYTTSKYFVLDLDAGDCISEIVLNSAVGQFDLNGYEHITDSQNRDFEEVLGQELITVTADRDFSGANNWANVTLSAFDSSGDLTISSTASGQYCGLAATYAPLVVGKTYRLTVTGSALSGNSFSIRDRDAYIFDGVSDNVLVSGTNTFTFIYNPTGGSKIGGFALRASGTGSITLDNVSVKEVGTHFGSELVTNGSFASDTDWAKTASGSTISGGILTLNNSDGTIADVFAYQDITTVVGKVYKVSFDITALTFGSSQYLLVADNANAAFYRSYRTAGTQNIFTFVANAVTTRLIFRRLSAGSGTEFNLIAGIDNVSVKEVLSETNVLPAQDFTSGWATESLTTINSSTKFTTSANGYGIYKTAIFTIGKTYKMRIAGYTTSSFAIVNSGNGTSYSGLIGTGAFDNSFVFTPQGNQTLYLQNSTAGVTEIFKMELYEIQTTFNDSYLAHRRSGSFNGTDNYVSVADNDNLDFGINDFTISFTINFASLANAPYLFRKIDGSGGYFILMNSDGTARVYVGLTEFNNLNIGTVSLNTNYHFDYVFNRSGNLLIYKNGVLANTTNISGASAQICSSPTALSLSISSVYTLNGKIYQSRLFNRALSAAEVLTYYNGGRPELYRTPVADFGASQTELITVAADRDFSSDTGFWVKGTGWTISGGTANVNGTLDLGTGTSLCKVGFLTIGKTYKLTYTISNYVSGILGLQVPNVNLGSSNGTFSVTFVATNTQLGFNKLSGSSNPTVLSIDNVSVVQVGVVAEYKFNQVSGTTVHDYSLNGLHGTVNGTTTNFWQRENYGNHSVEISDVDKKAGTYSAKIISTGVGDGTSNYIQLPSTSLNPLESAKKYTIEAWARGTGVLGSDLASGWNFTSGWLVGSGATVSDNNTFVTSSGTNSWIFKAYFTTGLTYQVSISGTVSAGNLTIYDGNVTSGGYKTVTGTFNETFNLVALNTYILLKTSQAATVDITTLTVKEVTLPTTTLQIGSQSKSISSISCVPGTFTKLVWNFLATSNEVAQALKVWANQADGIYLDQVSVTQAYDMVITGQVRVGSAYTTGGQYIYSRRSGGVPYVQFGYNNTLIAVEIYDANSSTSISYSTPTVSDKRNHTIYALLDKINGIKVGYDGLLGTSNSFNMYGNMNNTLPLLLGKDAISSYNNGNISDVQLIRFSDIASSNFNAATAYNYYIQSGKYPQVTGGGATIIFDSAINDGHAYQVKDKSTYKKHGVLNGTITEFWNNKPLYFEQEYTFKASQISASAATTALLKLPANVKVVEISADIEKFSSDVTLSLGYSGSDAWLATITGTNVNDSKGVTVDKAYSSLTEKQLYIKKSAATTYGRIKLRIKFEYLKEV